MTDIIVVTHKHKEEVEALLTEIENNTPEPHRTIVTARIGASAATNRNYGLSQVESSVFVMLDDDMSGFYPGWLTNMLEPMVEEAVIISSARLLNPDGTRQSGMGLNDQSDKVDGWFDVINHHYHMRLSRLSTACLAIRLKGVARYEWGVVDEDYSVLFDEGFIGSGYEDTDYMNRVSLLYPNMRMVVNNNCRLTHHNLKQNQTGDWWRANLEYYLSKWPADLSAEIQLKELKRWLK